MTDPNYERWAQLADREAAGETLSPEETAFCRAFEQKHPACRRELQLWQEMADMQCEPDERTRSLVDAALESLACETYGYDEGDPESELITTKQHPLRWLAAAAGLAACVAIGWIGYQQLAKTGDNAVLERPTSRAELVYASGQVRVENKPVKVGDLLLAEGNIVEVLQGSACLAIDPGIDICMADQSRVRVTRINAEQQRLDLLAGRVTAKLEPQPEGSRFSVVANGAWVTAIGTAFTVEFSPDDKQVKATVLSGKVSVSGKRDRRVVRVVRAHQRAVFLGSKSRLEPVVRANESHHWALVRYIDLWQGPSTAVLDLSRAPAGAEVMLNGRGIGAAPLSSLIPVGRHRLELRIDGELVLQRPLSAQAGQNALSELDLESAIRAIPGQGDVGMDETKAGVQPEGPTPPLSAEVSAEQLMGVARRLMQRQKWSEAAFAYREVQQVHANSPEAHTVLVPLGQLELDHLSRPQVAKELFERYLREGGGALAQEARHARIRALHQLGRKQEEIEAIGDFLQRYPDSFEARALRQKLEDFTRRQGR